MRTLIDISGDDIDFVSQHQAKEVCQRLSRGLSLRGVNVVQLETAYAPKMLASTLQWVHADTKFTDVSGQIPKTLFYRISYWVTISCCAVNHIAV